MGFERTLHKMKKICRHLNREGKELMILETQGGNVKYASYVVALTRRERKLMRVEGGNLRREDIEELESTRIFSGFNPEKIQEYHRLSRLDGDHRIGLADLQKVLDQGYCEINECPNGRECEMNGRRF
ncbi:hypothetical protein ACFL0X_02370 [Nanoarchaeota archaeon]